MWLSAVGLVPENDPFFARTYPWYGFRVGLIGDLVRSTGQAQGELAETGADVRSLITLSLAGLTAGGVLLLSSRRLSRKQ
jgi:hypothetical protein